MPAGGALQRGDGGRLVEVDDPVELVGQRGVEVVAQALGLGSVDDADGPLQPGCSPAPTPIAPRVAATSASSGKVTEICFLNMPTCPNLSHKFA